MSKCHICGAKPGERHGEFCSAGPPRIKGGQGRTAEEIERDGTPCPELVSLALDALRPSNLIPFVAGFLCGWLML